ncbi:hypothetical protein Tco_0424008 [Tanacetum coccineum]
MKKATGAALLSISIVWDITLVVLVYIWILPGWIKQKLFTKMKEPTEAVDYTKTMCKAFLFFCSLHRVGFGAGVIAVVGLSLFAVSVSDLWVGMVETIVFSISSMMVCDGVPAESNEK